MKIDGFLQSDSQKISFNKEHFTISAPKYDVATRLLSLWQDAKWKRKLIELMPCAIPEACLDLACGTGDLAIALHDKYKQTKVIGSDITQAMLDIAKVRSGKRDIEYTVANISSLPFDTGKFDIITGGYALRNAPSLKDALSEIYRCLKPKGEAYFLDFSKPDNEFAQKMQYYLLKYWGSLWGVVLHGSPMIHGYISASLKIYPNSTQLTKMVQDAGFVNFERYKLFGGMMEILVMGK